MHFLKAGWLDALKTSRVTCHQLLPGSASRASLEPQQKRRHCCCHPTGTFTPSPSRSCLEHSSLGGCLSHTPHSCPCPGKGGRQVPGPGPALRAGLSHACSLRICEHLWSLPLATSWPPWAGFQGLVARRFASIRAMAFHGQRPGQMTFQVERISEQLLLGGRQGAECKPHRYTGFQEKQGPDPESICNLLGEGLGVWAMNFLTF